MAKKNIDNISCEYAQIIRNKLKDRIKKIILFGSYARGDYKKGSDYDILIVIDKRRKKDNDILLDLGVEFLNKHDVLIGEIVCDEKEWERKKQFPIGLNILKEGIEL